MKKIDEVNNLVSYIGTTMLFGGSPNFTPRERKLLTEVVKRYQKLVAYRKEAKGAFRRLQAVYERTRSELEQVRGYNHQLAQEVHELKLSSQSKVHTTKYRLDQAHIDKEIGNLFQTDFLAGIGDSDPQASRSRSFWQRVKDRF